MVWLQYFSTTMVIVNILFALTVIFLERKNVGMTWAWLMVLLLLPVVGFILYLFFGQNLSKRKLYKISRESSEIVSLIIEGQRQAYLQNAIDFKDDKMMAYRNLVYMNLTGGYALYTQDNDIKIHVDGQDKFAALFAAIEAARKHVHLLYYIIQDDSIGRKLLQLLVQKAKEGVEIRFLYDDIGSTSLSRTFWRPLIEAGGQVAAFFPTKIPFINIRVNYRNHRKIVVIDGEVGFTGGFNVGDEYLGLDSYFGYWRDTHLELRGSSVLQMQAHFLLDWNIASEIPLEEHPDYFPVVEPAGEIGVQILSSGPNNEEEQIKNAYIKMIHAANTKICIQSPYFIPDESVLTALKLASLSGVQVELMIPAKPDHRMVYWASYSYLGDVLNAGGRVLLYEGGFLHAKTLVVDGQIASVGTANIDNRSFKLNFEITAIVYDAAKASELEQIFERDRACSRELTLDEYAARSRMQRVRESLMRLLSPIL